MTQTPEFLQKIDWALLREQKQTLLKIAIMSYLTDQDHKSFDGLIHMIDSMQDYATDVMGLSDKEVFNLIPEDDESS